MSKYSITLHDLNLTQLQAHVALLNGQATTTTSIPAAPPAPGASAAGETDQESTTDFPPSTMFPPAGEAASQPGGWPETVDISKGLDKGGLPWDSRINAKAGTKTQPGIFKLAKGVDKTLVEQVKAELKAIADAMGGETGAQANAGAAPPPPPAAGAQANAGAAPPPPANTTAAPPPPAAGSAAPTGAKVRPIDLINLYSKLVNEGHATAEELTFVLNTHGLPEAGAAVTTTPEVRNAVYAELQQYICD